MSAVNVCYEYQGYSDYWGGNGRRWDDNAGCLFAFYDNCTTYGDLVDQWVSDFNCSGDCDDFPEWVTADMVRQACLDALRVSPDTLVDPDCEVGNNDESPIYVVLVEIDVCPDCGGCPGDNTNDGLCQACHDLHYPLNMP